MLVAVDVQNPLLGPQGATRVYGPQKGLCPADFRHAECCLRRLAKVVTFSSLWLTHALAMSNPQYLASLKPLYQSLVWLTVGLCLLRGIPVLLDGRLYFANGFRQADTGP